MSIEAGARAGMVAPDDTTFAYLQGRPFAPQGRRMGRGGRALARAADRRRRGVRPRGGARRRGDRADGDLGHQPGGRRADHRRACPTPATSRDPERAGGDGARARLHGARRPAPRSTTIAVDRVFIGSCTNGRIEDLRAAAAVVRAAARSRDGVARLGGAGLGLVKAQAEAEGLDRVFTAAGFEWREAGCSMCLGTNGEIVAPGRALRLDLEPQLRRPPGPGARTHLMSPAMAAAAGGHRPAHRRAPLAGGWR